MNTSKTKISRNTNNLANGMECLIFSEPQTSPRKDLYVAKTYTNFKNNSIPRECWMQHWTIFPSPAASLESLGCASS